MSPIEYSVNVIIIMPDICNYEAVYHLYKFLDWVTENHQADSGFLNKIIFSNEAHFKINCKQAKLS